MKRTARKTKRVKGWALVGKRNRFIEAGRDRRIMEQVRALYGEAVHPCTITIELPRVRR